jgi:TonB-dependent starch-binding outer membrane protein SusC
MKKPEIQLSGECYFDFKRILLIMKLTTLLLIVALLQVSAEGFSQYGKLTLNLNNATMKEVFTAIENKTDYKFLYRDDDLENLAVNIDATDKSLDEILSLALMNSNRTYKILADNLIVIMHESPSQPLVISGTVTDATTHEPLPGVNIVIEGTTKGVISDPAGKYSIEVSNNNSVLTFSFIGYIKQSIKVTGQAKLDVQLGSDALALEEVVVIGYGTQNKREISGSVSNISEKNFNKGVSRDAVDLLQGKVAGLVITKGSGDVTGGNTIRLRGTSSLTGSSEPFVVIDGVPGVSMNSVSTEDIESISILKDASSAAIYGSRSASGVILITTKKAKVGKTTVDYNGYFAIDQVSNKPDLLTAAEWRKYCADNSINITGLDLGANTDWFDEIMRIGKTQNHSLSLSAGTEKSNYRASFSYMDRQGVVKDNEMKRLNGRLVFNQKALDDKLNISFISNVSQSDYTPSNTRNFVLAYNMIPVYPVKNADGSWYDNTDYDHGNPVRNIELNSNLNKTTQFSTNAKADLKLFNGFVAGLNAYKERSMNDNGQYNNSETEAGRTDLGYASRSSSTSDKNLLELTLKYDLKKGSHNINLLGGYSYEDNYYQSASAENRQFVTNIFDYNNLGAGENLKVGSVSSSASMNKLISFFGRINYVLNEKYILTATLRRDGSSKFGKNNKWGTFPSVSAAWIISDESFMKSLSIINNLKFRVSYGVAGNQSGLASYRTLALYSASSTKYYDNSKYLTAYSYSQNPNPNLKWEQTASLDVGIDFDILKSRINGSFGYYDKRTSNLLYTYSVPVPPYLYNSLMANVGDMSNKGMEFIINGDVINNKDLIWTLSLNLAHNVNKITKLSNSEFTTTAIHTGSAYIRGGSNTYTHIIEEGQSVGTFFGYKCIGLNSDGTYKMQDITDPSVLNSDDWTIIGNAQPKLTYGISSSLTYKRLDFSFFLRGVYGNDVLNFSRMSFGNAKFLPGSNVLKEALTNGLTQSSVYCSYYIEKGSFLRMDNASLGYNFDTKKFLGVEKMRFYVTGQNLFVITKYKGLDPEVSMSGLDPGVEGRDYYPKSRTISLGLNLTF